MESGLKTGMMYLRKRNIEITTENCEACGRNTDLKSYNARKYFGVLGIPLLPLGERRIIDECSACGNSRIFDCRTIEDYRRTYGVIIIYLLFLFFLGISYLLGLSREVYLVNGLDRPYELELNGERIELPPFSHKEIRIPEGEYTIHVEGLWLSPPVITVKTPFFKRFFDKNTFVINPDGTAVLLWEETTYMTDSLVKQVELAEKLDNKATSHISSVQRYNYQYHAGQFFWEFRDIHYCFRDFPDKIEIDDAKEHSYRYRISQVSEYNPFVILNELLMAEKIENIQSWLRCQVAANPSDTGYLSYFALFVPPDEAIAFLRQRLDERPVLVDWHRYYQTLCDRFKPDYDLVAEYTGYLSVEPDNPSLQYLLGRVMRDPQEAEKMYRKSIDHEEPCPFGYFAIACQAQCAGEFQKAKEYMSHALAFMPERKEYNTRYDDLLWALGEYDTLLARTKKQQETNPYSFELIAEIIRVYKKQGRKEEAEEVIDEYLSFLEAEGIEPTEYRQYLQAVSYYSEGDLVNCARSLAALNDIFSFELHFTAGRLEEAWQVLNEQGRTTATEYLLLYIAAAIEGEKEAAATYLEKATGLMTNTAEERYVAACLQGAFHPQRDKITHLPITPAEKSIMLTALGVKYPEDRSFYFALADCLNYRPAFPYHFLKRIHR